MGNAVQKVESKTHYRKAFNSPYLSSADIVGPTVLTIERVSLEIDKTKKTKDYFNTAYFVEKELRPGEKMKPMILNATNSKTLAGLFESKFIEDWSGPVTIYVDPSVRFGKETMEGLRIMPQHPQLQKREVKPENTNLWNNALAAYKRDGNFQSIEEKAFISEENKQLMIQQAREGAE